MRCILLFMNIFVLFFQCLKALRVHVVEWIIF
jgi:hypothetical protein